MTIQRKYSLPNCTLIIEGLSSPPSGNGQAEARPLLSMLINAECHFSATNTTLTGGRDFFEGLVTTVSAYAQEFLSKVPHPQAHQAGLVQLQRVDGNWHRLTVSGTEEVARQPTQVDLTTVQLFDLVEAVDQFFADSQTLPDLPPQLKIAARRRSSQMGGQAVPAAVGVSSLALAVIATFLMPIPPVQRPTQPTQKNTTTSTTTTPTTTTPTTTTPTNSASNQSAASPTSLAASPTTASPTTAATTPAASPSTPSTTDLETTLNTAPEITDSSQLYTLNRKLRDQIDQGWKTRSKVNQDLVYRVSVASDGAIIGYKPINSAAGNLVDQTPLPGLVYTPAKNSAATHDPIAQFKVVFTAKGVPQVSPWGGYKQPPRKILGERITDSKQLANLKRKVYQQVRQNWSGTPTYRRDLIYRVATNKDGVIADYEPTDQPAYDYVKETPLPKLSQPSSGSEKGAVKTQEPLAQFKVVFKPNGVLEVGQW